MTAQKALYILKNRNEKLKLNHKIKNRDIADKEVKEISEVIEKLLEPLQELVDKETPLKPKEISLDNGASLYVCSICGEILREEECCSNNECRQKIDWEE